MQRACRLKDRGVAVRRPAGRESSPLMGDPPYSEPLPSPIANIHFITTRNCWNLLADARNVSWVVRILCGSGVVIYRPGFEPGTPPWQAGTATKLPPPSINSR